MPQQMKSIIKAYEKAMEKLYQAQKQKAVTEVNRSKQFDLGREYSKYLNDVIMPDQIEESFRKNKRRTSTR
jgi:hypothetical protein